MQKLYDDFKSNVYYYGGYPDFHNERNLIKSLDIFVNELYSGENYLNENYITRCEMKNDYRNVILLIINDFVSNKLRQFPSSIEQLHILVKNFYDKKLKNPVVEIGYAMRSDLEKPVDERKYTNEEWESKMDLANYLAKYWEGDAYSNLYDIYNSLFKEYPRVNILKHWNYGFDPQSFIDLENSLNERLGQSSYLKEAERFLNEKYEFDDISNLKNKNSNIYHDLLFNELLSRFNSYKFHDYHMDHYDPNRRFDIINELEKLMDSYDDDVYSNSFDINESEGDDLVYDPYEDPMTQAEELMEEAFEQANPNSVSSFLEKDLVSELVEPNSIDLDTDLIY